ncbi:hypothetical protein LOD99_7420 [Oopsacas minuta]|uniref:Transposase n=1 Tax=Oopsacas minuta TaxID=111878 RepID=A0AAV7JWG8_9METZ|nr:hypothetical protein LOD99_7420 [Oopsacas minuta]
MQDIYGDECPSKATIYRWIERFDNGDEELHDDPRPGRPTSSKTRSNIERVQTILDENRRITLRELEERVGISKATHSIITEDLEMSKAPCKLQDKAAIDDLGFECLPHPSYRPDLAPSDCWLFGEMKRVEDFKRLEYEIKQWDKGTP